MSTLLTSSSGPTAWTFTQGFLFGQATVILLGLLFVRYVVFSPADSVDPVAWRERREKREKVIISLASYAANLTESSAINDCRASATYVLPPRNHRI